MSERVDFLTTKQRINEALLECKHLVTVSTSFAVILFLTNSEQIFHK